MPVVLQDSTLAGNTVIGHAGDASGDTSGRQLDGFVVTFDRPWTRPDPNSMRRAVC